MYAMSPKLIKFADKETQFTFALSFHSLNVNGEKMNTNGFCGLKCLCWRLMVSRAQHHLTSDIYARVTTGDCAHS